jgi:hypothetical protein
MASRGRLLLAAIREKKPALAARRRDPHATDPGLVGQRGLFPALDAREVEIERAGGRGSRISPIDFMKAALGYPMSKIKRKSRPGALSGMIARIALSAASRSPVKKIRGSPGQARICPFRRS